MRIGLTGGIASGKSTVSRYLRALGAVVIDADVLAREAIAPGTRGFNAVSEHFPNAIKDGQIDRRALAKTIFADPEKRRILENIVHPYVFREMDVRAGEAEKKGEIVILDIPLLFETCGDGFSDVVWVVHVDRTTQLDRLCRRDGLTFAEANQRIEAQMPLDSKAERADEVIDNSGSLAWTKYQIRRLWRKFRETSIDCP